LFTKLYNFFFQQSRGLRWSFSNWSFSNPLEEWNWWV